MNEIGRSKRIEQVEHKPQPEEVIERTCYRDAERAAIADIERRHGEHIPAERLELLRQCPTILADRAEFQRLYQFATGEEPNKYLNGFSTSADAPSVVLIEGNPDVADTLYHELLHRASSPDFVRQMPEAWREGITEKKTQDAVGFPPENPIYPTEITMALQLEKACGSDAVDKAYFAGDLQELRAHMDQRLEDRSKSSPGQIEDGLDNRERQTS
jgi:hypothetical protein